MSPASEDRSGEERTADETEFPDVWAPADEHGDAVVDEERAAEEEREAEQDREEYEREGRLASRRLRNGLISLVALIVLVVGLLLAIPGLHKVGDAVAEMDGGWVILAVVLEIGSCIGYVVAFLQVFERAPIRFGARVALSELAFNSAVSLGGAGSVAVGAWMLVDRGAPIQRVAERSAVLFLLTSAINVLTFVVAGIFFTFGIWAGPGSRLLLGLLPAAIGTIGLAFFLLLPRLIDRGLARRLPHKVERTLETLAESIRHTGSLLRRPDWRILGSIGYLWCDIAVLVVCFAAAGASLPLSAIVLAYQIAYMSNLIPVPGGIGVLDGSLVGMLVLYGAQGTPALAATVVYHAIALWIPALWGTVAFVVARRTRNQPLVLRSPRRSSE
jgi:uncharacterized protein (TIRG00374 family)